MIISSAHLAAMLAFSLWGLFPIYWKFFGDVEAWDLFAHRLMWSFITLTVIIAFRGKLKDIRAILKSRRTTWMLVISALLISSNWLLYIYAVNIGRILEASMGYFLNPLINVFMGWLILKEKIRPTQWPAILLAVLAMVLLALQTDLHHFPWIALVLSITFALYGLIRKLAHVGSMEGLTFETIVIIGPVMIYWFLRGSSPVDALEMMPGWKYGILMLSGVVTSLPLILFAFAAKRLTLQTLGFIQYLSPSLKFICGLFIFHEVLSVAKLQAFFIIWVALAYYTAESFAYSRKKVDKTASVSE